MDLTSVHDGGRRQPRTRPGGTTLKGLVLAGGSGRRLRPITSTVAKQLVPVANRPILLYGLEQLRAAGITEVAIVVGDTAPAIEAVVGDGSALGLTVTYLPQAAPLGLAHALLLAEGFAGGDDLLMFLGDNLLEDGVASLVAAFTTHRPAAQLLLTPVANPERFGVAEVDDDGRIRHLEEKPATPRSNLALVGAYAFSPAIFDAARRITPSARGELEITDALKVLIEDGADVRASRLAGWWLDTGKKDDLLEANRVVLSTLTRRVEGRVDADSSVVGEVVLAPGAQLIRSTVRGPAVIGADAVIEDTYIGPFTSIGDRCHLARCEVEHSVLMEGCTVRDVPRLEGSLLGKDVEVVQGPARPAAHRLLLGDHSRVELPRSP